MIEHVIITPNGTTDSRQFIHQETEEFVPSTSTTLDSSGAEREVYKWKKTLREVEVVNGTCLVPVSNLLMGLFKVCVF